MHRRSFEEGDSGPSRHRSGSTERPKRKSVDALLDAAVPPIAKPAPAPPPPPPRPLTLKEDGISTTGVAARTETSLVKSSTVKRRKKAGGSGFAGLTNQGATCYMNSLLQSLFMTPEFRRVLFSWRYDKDKDDEPADCIPYQLQLLFAQLQLTEQRAVSTTSLTTSFGWTSRDSFQQHDVQELARVLFDALERSLSGTASSQLISDLFKGSLSDYVRCEECGKERTRVDTFLDLSLVIKPFGSDKAVGSVQEALEEFTKAEVMDGDNKVECERCGKRTKSTKGLKLAQAPYLLQLSLKRFVFNFESLSREKLNDCVTFPLLLDLNGYVNGSNSKNNNTAASAATAASAEAAANSNHNGNDDGSFSEASPLLPAAPPSASTDSRAAAATAPSASAAAINTTVVEVVDNDDDGPEERLNNDNREARRGLQHAAEDYSFGLSPSNTSTNPFDANYRPIPLPLPSPSEPSEVLTAGMTGGRKDDLLLEEDDDPALRLALAESLNVSSSASSSSSSSSAAAATSATTESSDGKGGGDDSAAASSSVCSDGAPASASAASHASASPVPLPDNQSRKQQPEGEEKEKEKDKDKGGGFDNYFTSLYSGITADGTSGPTTSTSTTATATATPTDTPVASAAAGANAGAGAGVDEQPLFSSTFPDPPTLSRLLKERGPFLYELYGVLVHSGSASGGHYYAYIKDLEESSSSSGQQQWYQFNDSSVTSVELSEVMQAAGGKVKSAYGTGYSYTSSANAYMLMYRRCIVPPSASSSSSSSFVELECRVPKEVADAIPCSSSSSSSSSSPSTEERKVLRFGVSPEDEERERAEKEGEKEKDGDAAAAAAAAAVVPSPSSAAAEAEAEAKADVDGATPTAATTASTTEGAPSLVPITIRMARSFPSDEDIPSYISEAIVTQQEREKKEQQEEEEKRDLIALKVYYRVGATSVSNGGSEVKTINVRKNKTTVAEATKLAWLAFGLDKGLPAPVAASPAAPPPPSASAKAAEAAAAATKTEGEKKEAYAELFASWGADDPVAATATACPGDVLVTTSDGASSLDPSTAAVMVVTEKIDLGNDDGINSGSATSSTTTTAAAASVPAGRPSVPVPLEDVRLRMYSLYSQAVKAPLSGNKRKVKVTTKGNAKEEAKKEGGAEVSSTGNPFYSATIVSTAAAPGGGAPDTPSAGSSSSSSSSSSFSAANGGFVSASKVMAEAADNADADGWPDYLLGPPAPRVKRFADLKDDDDSNGGGNSTSKAASSVDAAAEQKPKEEKGEKKEEEEEFVYLDGSEKTLSEAGVLGSWQDLVLEFRPKEESGEPALWPEYDPEATNVHVFVYSAQADSWPNEKETTPIDRSVAVSNRMAKLQQAKDLGTPVPTLALPSRSEIWQPFSVSFFINKFASLGALGECIAAATGVDRSRQRLLKISPSYTSGGGSEAKEYLSNVALGYPPLPLPAGPAVASSNVNSSKDLAAYARKLLKQALFQDEQQGDGAAAEEELLPKDHLGRVIGDTLSLADDLSLRWQDPIKIWLEPLPAPVPPATVQIAKKEQEEFNPFGTAASTDQAGADGGEEKKKVGNAPSSTTAGGASSHLATVVEEDVCTAQAEADAEADPSPSTSSTSDDPFAAISGSNTDDVAVDLPALPGAAAAAAAAAAPAVTAGSAASSNTAGTSTSSSSGGGGSSNASRDVTFYSSEKGMRPVTAADSRAAACYDRALNSITCRYNDPRCSSSSGSGSGNGGGGGAGASTGLPSPSPDDFTGTIVLDQRSTSRQLYAAMAAKLDLPLGTFTITLRKLSSLTSIAPFAKPLKLADSPHAINEGSSYYASMNKDGDPRCLLIQFGTPLQGNESLCNLYLRFPESDVLAGAAWGVPEPADPTSTSATNAASPSSPAALSVANSTYRGWFYEPLSADATAKQLALLKEEKDEKDEKDAKDAGAASSCAEGEGGEKELVVPLDHLLPCSSSRASPLQQPETEEANNADGEGEEGLVNISLRTPFGLRKLHDCQPGTNKKIGDVGISLSLSEIELRKRCVPWLIQAGVFDFPYSLPPSASLPWTYAPTSSTSSTPPRPLQVMAVTDWSHPQIQLLLSRIRLRNRVGLKLGHVYADNTTLGHYFSTLWDGMDFIVELLPAPPVPPVGCNSSCSSSSSSVFRGPPKLTHPVPTLPSAAGSSSSSASFLPPPPPPPPLPGSLTVNTNPFAAFVANPSSATSTSTSTATASSASPTTTDTTSTTTAAAGAGVNVGDPRLIYVCWWDRARWRITKRREMYVWPNESLRSIAQRIASVPGLADAAHKAVAVMKEAFPIRPPPPPPTTTTTTTTAASAALPPASPSLQPAAVPVPVPVAAVAVAAAASPAASAAASAATAPKPTPEESADANKPGATAAATTTAAVTVADAGDSGGLLPAPLEIKEGAVEEASAETVVQTKATTAPSAAASSAPTSTRAAVVVTQLLPPPPTKKPAVTFSDPKERLLHHLAYVRFDPVSTNTAANSAGSSSSGASVFASAFAAVGANSASVADLASHYLKEGMGLLPTSISKLPSLQWRYFHSDGDIRSASSPGYQLDDGCTLLLADMDAPILQLTTAQKAALGLLRPNGRPYRMPARYRKRRQQTGEKGDDTSSDDDEDSDEDFTQGEAKGSYTLSFGWSNNKGKGKKKGDKAEGGGGGGGGGATTEGNAAKSDPVNYWTSTNNSHNSGAASSSINYKGYTWSSAYSSSSSSSASSTATTSTSSTTRPAYSSGRKEAGIKIMTKAEREAQKLKEQQQQQQQQGLAVVASSPSSSSSADSGAAAAPTAAAGAGAGSSKPLKVDAAVGGDDDMNAPPSSTTSAPAAVPASSSASTAFFPSSGGGSDGHAPSSTTSAPMVTTSTSSAAAAGSAEETSTPTSSTASSSYALPGNGSTGLKRNSLKMGAQGNPLWIQQRSPAAMTTGKRHSLSGGIEEAAEEGNDGEGKPTVIPYRRTSFSDLLPNSSSSSLGSGPRPIGLDFYSSKRLQEAKRAELAAAAKKTGSGDKVSGGGSRIVGVDTAISASISASKAVTLSSVGTTASDEEEKEKRRMFLLEAGLTEEDFAALSGSGSGSGGVDKGAGALFDDVD